MNNILRMALALCLVLLAGPVHALVGGELRVGVKPTSPPFSFLDTQKGEVVVRGLDVDLGELLGKLTGRKASFFPSADLEQRRQWLLDGKIDVILFDSPALKAIPEFLYIPLNLSLKRRLFVNEKCLDVVCLKDLDERRVVMVTGDELWSHTAVPAPEDLLVVESPEEALRLLDEGAVDVYIAPSERVAEAYIAKNEFQHIRKVGMVLEKIPLYMTIRRQDVEFGLELREAMRRIEADGVMEVLKNKWFGVSYAPTLWTRYARVILGSVAAVLAILLGVLIWNQQLKAKVRSVTRHLADSERYYRSFIESSPEMILVVDRERRVRLANTLARTMTANLDVEGASILDVIAEEDMESCDIFIKNVLDNGFASAELLFNAKEGGAIEADVAATRMEHYPSGDPCACLFARDVTERNRIEQELTQADRLVTIGRLAAGVAHEINNPLGIVLANVELILSRRLSLEESEEHLDAIRRNTVRAGKITRDLLAVARPQEPSMSEVDLHELVIMTLSMLKPHTKDIEVVHKPPEKPLLIWADANLLQQVVVNVVLNAKAALNGREHPRLELRYCCPGESDIVRLFIKDNGKGIPRSQLNEVFEPFMSAGKPEGFGLGLFISRRIIERHGGVMYAESGDGSGTLMVIELPKRPASRGQAMNERESS